MAKSKTTTKKASTRKKAASKKTSTGATRSGKKAATAPKKPAAGKKASASTRKKPATKKTTKKKTGKTTRKTTGKSPATQPPAAEARGKKEATEELTKKTTTKKKVAKKPTTKKTTSKKTAKKDSSSKKTTVKKKTTAKKSGSTRKKTAGASSGGAGSRRRGRSVAEAASATEADHQGYVFINGRRVRMISTKGQAPQKKVRAADAAATQEQESPAPAKPVKTHLSRKQLSHYRQLLLAKRRELCGDLDAMEQQALKSGGGNLSHMPIHMADIGSDTYDQDFMLGLAESERQRLREIDHALKRITDRTYGVCQMTGNPIPDARLEAKPWAKYTIEAARELEGRWGT